MDMQHFRKRDCRVTRHELSYRCDLFPDLPCCTRCPSRSTKSCAEVTDASTFPNDLAATPPHALSATHRRAQESATREFGISLHGASAPWNGGTRENGSGIHNGHDKGSDTSQRRQQHEAAGIWFVSKDGKPTQPLVGRSEEYNERTKFVSGASAVGNGKPETPERKSDIDGGPGFMPTDEILARFPRLFYNLGNLNSKP